jgi:hypothetical protein
MFNCFYPETAVSDGCQLQINGKLNRTSSPFFCQFPARSYSFSGRSAEWEHSFRGH